MVTIKIHPRTSVRRSPKTNGVFISITKRTLDVSEYSRPRSKKETGVKMRRKTSTDTVYAIKGISSNFYGLCEEMSPGN